jgi:hypothetical protein
MKKTRLFSLLILVVSFCANAQQFVSGGGKINDFKDFVRTDTFKIEVKNLPLKADSKFGISKVCFNISHTRASD